jgi:hypothetical protein
MKIRDDFKYKVIKNFLTKAETSLLKDYSILTIRHNEEYFDLGQSSSVPNLCMFSDPIMESLMLQKRLLVQKQTGLELLPTYTYWRAYTKFSDLPKHKDRPSCEISVTVNMGSDGTPWPIFMDNTPLNLNPGDAAVYLGCEVEHWREEFQGDWCSQVFMHYVDKNGPYKSFFKDGRIHYGLKERYENI